MESVDKKSSLEEVYERLFIDDYDQAFDYALKGLSIALMAEK